MAMAAPAAATVTVNFTAHVSNADFLPPLPATLSDRSITLTGSFTYQSGLADGVYGASALTDFDVEMERDIVTAGPPNLTFSASYHFTLADVSALALVLSGGVPTDAAWLVDPKLPYAFTLPALGAQYAFFTLDTTQENSVSFFAGSSPTDYVELAEVPGKVTSIVENAVPEPASWALMIAGFGLTGAAMRRRQRVSVSYA
jgi:hypothetical protein